ncbi:glycosyltransferase [Candidatus Bathyarchaeota archaeon]|nr:glycosyltransferase [Candidatus Bathyarchaeota archaeon]
MSILSQLSFHQQIILTLTTVITAILGTYALNWSLLTILSLKSRRKNRDPPPPEEWPEVTIHIPLFNESMVAGRLINSCLRMDYPKEKLKIIIVDDSDDETTEIARRFERDYPENVRLIHRESRVGFKAGALQEALKNTTSDYIMVFDADYVPPPDLIKRLIPHIYHTDDVAFVQARLTYLNQRQTWVTKSLSLAIDGYGIVDQRARYSSGLLAHFSGTGGLFRRLAIEEVGGWASDTLTEDLDLSIRLQLKGWRYIYLPDLTCPGEIPPTFNLLRRQQYRWAKGFAQCFRKYWRQIISSPDLSIFKKFEAFMLLSTYFVCPISVLGLALIPIYFAVIPASFLMKDYWQTIFAPVASGFSAAIYIAPLLLYGTTLTELAKSDVRDYARLKDILGLSILGLGTLISNSKATVEGLLMKTSIFHRTTKYGIVDEGFRPPSGTIKDGWLT